MQKAVVRFSFLVAAIAMIIPIMAQAGESHSRYIAGANEAADFKGDDKGLKAFATNEANTGLVRVDGDITAVSATSITVLGHVKTTKAKNDANVNASSETNTDDTAYTFVIDTGTKVLRRFRGLSMSNELTVGDEVRVWANKLEGGTAKLILDKSIWWLRVGGKAVEVNDTTQTFRLLLPIRKHGRLKTFSGEIRTSNLTQYIKADGTAGTFTDIDNNDRVRVRGVWNNEGYYLNARKIWLVE